MRMRRAYKKREAFSLIELIIAIAILVIFVGGATLSLSLLRSADTRGLASGVNDSLTDLKALTESHKGPYYLHLYRNDDGYYANYSDSETFDVDSASGDELIGSGALNLQYDSTDMSAGDYVTITIRKKDGSYGMAPAEFTVLNGTTAEYKVVLAKDTGLHYMEKV